MARKARSVQVRARIAQGIRLQRIGAGSYVWSDAAIAMLRKAYAEGGFVRCAAVFSQLREGQLRAAIRRYAQNPNVDRPAPDTRSVWDSPDFNRRFMEALTGRTY